MARFSFFKIYLLSTLNNIHITVTDGYGKTLFKSSSGSLGFKGSRKALRNAAQAVGESVGKSVAGFSGEEFGSGKDQGDLKSPPEISRSRTRRYHGDFLSFSSDRLSPSPGESSFRGEVKSAKHRGRKQGDQQLIQQIPEMHQIASNHLATPEPALASKTMVRSAEPQVFVICRGIGNGKEAGIRGLRTAGVQIVRIEDQTAIAHNGCRLRKRRRV
jgi:ribosomal protein S11